MLQLISEKSKNHYYEQLYVNKLDNREETDDFLETYSLSILNHEEIENLNKPITSNEIESVIFKTPQKTKVQVQMASQVDSTKH